MSFQNTFIPFKLTEPERRISRLKLWLDREKHALSQRGEAGCSQCHNAVRSLDMDSLETPEIPDSATLHDDLGKAGQRMKHLNAMILRARHALSTCTQCSRFLACDGPVLRVTDHPPNFSTLPPQIPGYASAEQKGLEKSMPAFGAGHISPPLRQLPSTQISLPFPSPPQSYSGMEGSLRTLTSLPSIVQPKAPSVDVLQLSSCARVDPRFVNAVFKCKGAERAGKLKTMLDQVLNQDFIFLTRPRYDWTSFNDPDIKAYTSGTAGYLPSEMAEQITRGLAEKMTRPSRRIQEHERFLLVCHCKVLKSMGVSVHGIMQTFALRGKVSIQKLKSHLHGIVWANRLLEGLYSRGWGHQAVDILLLWKHNMSTYYMLKQGGGRLHDFLLRELAKPEYRNRFVSVPGRVNKSIPSIVQATLNNTVSYRDVCLALGYTTQYVEATEDGQSSVSPTLSTVNDIGNSTMSASSSVEDVSEGASYTGSFRHAQNSPEDGSSGDNDGTDMVGDIKQSDARLHNQNMELELEEWLAKHSATPEGSMDEKW